MEVNILPLSNKKWHGHGGTSADFSKPTVLQALIGSDGLYATGLTEEEEKKYSEMLGVNLSKIPVFGKEHPFYSMKQNCLELSSNATLLKTENPRDFLKYKIALASKYVANSKEEYDEGLWPNATHYIYSKEEEVLKEAKKINLKDSARTALNKLSAESMKDVLQIISETDLSKSSADFIAVEKEHLIDTQAERIVELCSQGKERIHARSILNKALKRGVIVKDNGVYKFMNTVLGTDMDQVTDWYLSQNDETLKLSIQEKIK